MTLASSADAPDGAPPRKKAKISCKPPMLSVLLCLAAAFQPHPPLLHHTISVWFVTFYNSDSTAQPVHMSTGLLFITILRQDRVLQTPMWTSARLWLAGAEEQHRRR